MVEFLFSYNQSYLWTHIYQVVSKDELIQVLTWMHDCHRSIPNEVQILDAAKSVLAWMFSASFNYW